MERPLGIKINYLEVTHMPQFAYDFDPHNSNKNNIVTASYTLSKASSNKALETVGYYRVVIPDAAPFFYDEVLDVKLDGNKLTEGVDYYITHRYHRGILQTGKRLNGGVWIINPNLHGELEITCHTLGWKYTASREVIDDYLNNRMEDPSLESWEMVLNDDPFFPDVEIQFDRESFIDEQDLQVGLDKLAEVIRNKDPQNHDLYEIMVDWFERLKKDVDDSTLLTHGDNTDNPHGTKWYHADALHKEGVAKDTYRAFGMLIDELTTYINERGIVQDDLAPFALLRGGNVFKGDIVLEDGLAVLGFDKDNETQFQMEAMSDDFITSGKVGAYIHADAEKKHPGLKLSLVSGNNALTITSRGKNKTDDLLINDKHILHEGNLNERFPDAGTYIIDIHTKDTPSLKFSGKGVSGDPLKMEVYVPKATDVVTGDAVASDKIDGTDKTKVARSKATGQLADIIRSKVPTSRKINGKPLTGNIEIDADDVNLGNVHNLSDKDMPVNNNHIEVMDSKAIGLHSHTFEEMGIPNATPTVLGITKFTDDESVRDREITVSLEMAKLLRDRADNIVESAKRHVPSDALNITQYGGNDWLPVPVQGSYKGSGHQRRTRVVSAYIENGKRLIIYRNGADVDMSGVFYSYADLNNDGSMRNLVATALQYRPGNLPDSWDVKSSYRASRTAMILNATNGNKTYKLVTLFNGTGDGKQHKCVAVDGVFYGDAIPFIYGEYCYIVQVVIDRTSGVWHTFHRIPLSEFDNFNIVIPEEVTFSGDNFFGEPRSGHELKLADKSWSDDPNENVVCVRESSEYNINITWNGLGIASWLEGNRLRLFVSVGTYHNSSNGSHRSNWSYSVTINLDNNTQVVDPNNNFPFYVSREKGAYGGPTRNSTFQRMYGHSGNTYGIEVSDGKYAFVMRTFNEWTPKVVAQSWEADSYFDSLNADTRRIDHIGNSRRIVGNFGSIVTTMQKHLSFLPNNYLLADNGSNLCRYEPNYTYKNGLGGFGPTTDRTKDDDIRLRRNVYVIDGDKEELIGGVLNGHVKENFYTAGDGFDFSGKLSITDDNLQSLEREVSEKLKKIKTDHPFKYARAVILIPKDKAIPPFFIGGGLHDKIGGGYLSTYCAGTLEDCPREGDVGNVKVKDYIIEPRTITSPSGTSSYPRSWVSNGGIMYDRVAGKVLVAFNQGLALHANTGHHGFLAVVDLDTGEVDKFKRHNTYSYYANRALSVTKEYGLVQQIQDNSFTAVLGNKIGKTADTWVDFIDNGTTHGKVVLHTSQVASGWNIYFTQEIKFFTSGVVYNVPETAIDLTDNFPTTYKSNTFYLYVTAQGGNPRYIIRPDKVGDSSDTVYIGYCKTDDTSIIELEAERVTRLGSFREFQQHLEDPTPHDLDMSKINRDSLGLGLVENKPMKHDLKVATFKEVFNTWKRVSYQAGNSFPAIPKELETWSFNASKDQMRNTTNSSSWVGFVSPDVVGDYRFITGVSSTSADDDFIGVILAYKEIDGEPHMLSFDVCGTDTHSVHGYLRHSTPNESNVLASFKGHSGKYGWDQIPERVLSITRVGDIFTIEATKFRGQGGTDIKHTLDISSNADLKMFRGENKFGYIARSQPNSTWRNIIRPDEDGRGYYASMELYRNLHSWSNRMHVQSGKVMMPGTDSDDDQWSELLIPKAEGMEGYKYIVQINPSKAQDSGAGISVSLFRTEDAGSNILAKVYVKAMVSWTVYHTKYPLHYTVTYFTDDRINVKRT
jgi:hypothetical protein